MAGTGVHGYTGTSANGLYNISNGIVQSSAPSTNASSYYNNTSSASNNVSNAVSNLVSSITSAANTNLASNIASSVANTAGTSPSDYGDMIRQILQNQQANTAQSQQFAREQMEYQTRSDAAAMAWSANEAEKNRAWQESLADTAHQREVRDLVAAGLNPILSANQGAYTGSGATGQGFSSSGAMGQVDQSANGALGALMSTVMNTASQAAIAKMYTDATRYQADQGLAASKVSADASILNNQNTTSAQKQIAAKQIESELARTGMTAAATKYAADKNLAAAGATASAMRYSADQSLAASQFQATTNAETQKWMQEHNWNNDPLGYITGWMDELGVTDYIKDVMNNAGNPPTAGDYYGSGGSSSHRF